MEDALYRMTKARAAMIIDQRFFGSLALRLNLKEDATAETMWTDGRVLGYNPEFVAQLSTDELKGVVAHEVGHCILGHHLRRNGRDSATYNEACDYAVNGIIINSGFTLPADKLYSTEFENMNVDSIYNVLMSRKPDPKGDEDGGTGKGSGEQGQGQDGGNGKGDKGKEKADKGGCGEIRDQKEADGTELSEQGKKQQEQEWQIATAQAAQTAKGCGQLAGGVAELVKEMLEPKVPWTEVLQRFVDQISHNDYTYRRTNSRYAAFGLILPSLYNKTLPPIDVWIDTSGSIRPDDMKQFISEINDIRSHYSTTIRIIQCDTDVRHVEVVEPDMVLNEMKLYGRGGTRFAPAIQWSATNDEPPVCGIYLTDLECSDYGKEPDFPVLWIDTRNSSYADTPPFGEVVRMYPRRF